MPHLPQSYTVNSLLEPEVVVVGPQEGGPNMKENVQTLTSFPALEAQKDMGGVTCVESTHNGTSKAEQKGVDVMDGVEYTSRPPSPFESGATTPLLRIPSCPLRLLPTIPPPNYGATKNGDVYRSAFPQDRNLPFLKLLNVRNILCLVETQPSEAYGRWISSQGIKRHRVDIAPNKDGKIKTTWDSLCEALLIMMDSANYPLYVHCNQGRHRTGCVVACLRKIQRWPIHDILAEYDAYANPKARSGDVDLIRAFDPEAVFEYAKARGYLDDRPFMKRMDSAIANIDALAEALSGKGPCYDDMDISGVSSASTFSDDGIEMKSSGSEQHMLGTVEGTAPSVEVHVQAIETGDETVLDPALVADEPTTTVVELSEDVATPPAEPVMKTLGSV